MSSPRLRATAAAAAVMVVVVVVVVQRSAFECSNRSIAISS
jgi:hypothetical protein